MSVRTFDGTDDFIRCTGTLGASANGAFTMLGLVRPTTLPGGDEPFFSIGSGTSTTAATLYNDNGHSGADAGWGSSSSDSISSTYGLTATTWHFIAATKATGTVTPKFHRRTFGSGSWTHPTGTGTIANNATNCTDAFFGRFNDSATFRDFSLAVWAIFNVELADATIEALELAATTAGIAETAGVIGLWEFNQASTATTVTDLIGNTHEASKTGTSVSEGIDPAWTYGLAGWEPEVDSPRTLRTIAAPRL